MQRKEQRNEVSQFGALQDLALNDGLTKRWRPRYNVDVGTGWGLLVDGERCSENDRQSRVAQIRKTSDD